MYRDTQIRYLENNRPLSILHNMWEQLSRKPNVGLFAVHSNAVLDTFTTLWLV